MGDLEGDTTNEPDRRFLQIAPSVKTPENAGVKNIPNEIPVLEDTLEDVELVAEPPEDLGEGEDVGLSQHC